MKNFLIDVPPPTISGSLHMGHVFSYSQMNFIANYQRYLGKKVLYPFCFDINGLPTEKLAQKNNHNKKEDIIQFSENRSQEYKRLFDDIHMNFSNECYHTFNQSAVEIVNLSFQDLIDKGYVYRSTCEYFYCPVTKTSVSQTEIDENGCFERSGAQVELRTGTGWFIDILNHIQQIRNAIDQIKWHPDYLRQRLHSWLDDVKYDWSISRERNYGIPIPGENSNIVFDTWFTSSLSPQLSWSSYTKQNSLQCPIFDVRFQAHDIIRTWALFTIVKSLYHNNQIPWKNIVISGHVLDKNGRKLSKSLGNASDPYKYINQYRHYGIQYWAAHFQSGTDGKIDERLMKNAKRLKTKLFNAERFIQMNIDKGGENLIFEKLWLEEKNKILDDMENFDYTNAFRKLNDFFWNQFCGIMIEECKNSSTISTLNKIFKELNQLYLIFIG